VTWQNLTATEDAVSAGLRFGDAGTHTSRTMMLQELTDLLEAVPSTASREDYATAIKDENVLGKGTASTRRATNQRLGELYGLDPNLGIFRVLRRLWGSDEPGRPLLAILCALGRDPLLRATAPGVLALDRDQELVRSVFVATMKTALGHRFNESILDKVARNAASTWTQSGHLVGRVRKTRQRATATPSSVAFALWLGSLFHRSGEQLFESPWVKVLDLSRSELTKQVFDAKRMNLIRAYNGGDLLEIDPTGLDQYAA